MIANHNNNNTNMFDVIEYSSSASEYEVETKLMKKKKSKNKIRFSQEQIRTLEVIFESETKLESRKKVQLAKELGLQPRQVAIWFQNKRARWKSKQIEKDYNALLSSYNNLVSQFDSIKKDNQSLLIQLEKLKKEMKVGEGNMSSSTISDEGEYNKNMDFELLRRDYQRDEHHEHEHEQVDDHDNHELLMKIVEPVEENDHSLIDVTTSHEDWGSTLETPHHLSYLSWDFWS